MLLTALFIFSFMVGGAVAGAHAGTVTAAFPYVFLIYSGVTDPAIAMAVLFVLAGGIIGMVVGGLLAYSIRNMLPKGVQLIVACLILIIVPTTLLAQKTTREEKTERVERHIRLQGEASTPNPAVTDADVVFSDTKETATVTITMDGTVAGKYRLKYLVTDTWKAKPYVTGEQVLDLPEGTSSHTVQIDNRKVIEGYAAAALNVPISQAQIVVEENFAFKAKLLPVIDGLPPESIQAAQSSIEYVTFNYPMSFQITDGRINFNFDGNWTP